MADESVKRTITIVGASVGLGTLASDVDKVTAAQARAAAGDKAVASVRDTASKATAGLTARVEAFTRANDALTKAQAAVARGETLRTAQLAAGIAVSAGFERAQSTARARVKELEDATNHHTESLVLNRMQMMESMHVLKSLGDSVMAGASPIRALTMEGGRIAQIFGEGQGGAMGTLKAMGSTVGGLLTGWVGLGLGIAAAIGVATLAIVRFQTQQDKLALSLNGVGRASGLTLGGLTNVADTAARNTPGMSQGSATGLAAGYAHAGLSGGMIQGLLNVTKPYSTATGDSLSKSGEDLAKAFADPSKGAQELNEKLGFLDGTTRQLIDSMEASGNILGAQKLLLDKVGEAAKGAEDRTWSLALAWQKVSGAVGSAINAIGSAVSPSLERQRDDLASRKSSEENSWSIFRNDDVIKSLAAEIAKLDATIAVNNKVASDAAKVQADQKVSLQATDAVRSLDPLIAKQQELGDKVALLTLALGNPDIANRVPGGVAAIGGALGMGQNLQANSDPMLRLSQDSALEIQSIAATTLAQKEAIAARQAELQVLRESGDALRATAAAEAKRNEMLAQAQKEIDDATREANRNSSYARMSPYDAGRQRIIDQGSDFDRLHGGGTLGPQSSIDPSFAAYTAQAPDLANSQKALASQLDVFTKALDAADKAGDSTSIAAYTREVFVTAKALQDAKTNPASISSAYIAATPTATQHPAISALNMPAAANSNAARAGNAAGYTGNSSAITATNLSTYDYQKEMLPLRDANQALDAQNALLKVNADAGNQSAAATQGMLDRQKLLNEYIKEYGSIAKIPDSVISGLDAYGQKATAAAQAQDDLNKKIQAFDTVRSDVDTGMKTFVDDLVQGKSGADAFRDAMEQLAQKILNSGLDSLTTSLFGKAGSSSLGILGGGTGSSSGILGGLLGGLFGGGSTAGVGLFSNGFGSAPKFAGGGVMTSDGPVPLRRYAGGGVADSPQAAIYGEGSSPEAFVPLQDGRSIPVNVKGGSSGGPQAVTLRGGDLHVHGNVTDDVLPKVQAMIAASMQQTNAMLQRNMGQMQGKWTQRYGT